MLRTIEDVREMGLSGLESGELSWADFPFCFPFATLPICAGWNGIELEKSKELCVLSTSEDALSSLRS